MLKINGFLVEAHDAMVDVSATIAVAKALLQQQDRWHYLWVFLKKVLIKTEFGKQPICISQIL